MITSISITITFSSRVSSMSLRSSLVGKARSQASTSGWRSPGYLNKEEHHWQLFWKPMLQLCGDGVQLEMLQILNNIPWSEVSLNSVLFRCGWHLLCIKHFSSSVCSVSNMFWIFQLLLVVLTTLNMFLLFTCWISLHRRQGWDAGGRFWHPDNRNNS